MSELDPSVIVLDKGLNLQAPKVTAPVGTLLDSLNYEHVDFSGLKRIDGIERYDGTIIPDKDHFVKLSFEGEHDSKVGHYLLSASDSIYGYICAADPDNTSSFYVYVMDSKVPVVAGTILKDGEYTNSTIAIGFSQTVAEVDTAPEFESPDINYELILSAHNAIRGKTSELHNNVAGLHYHNDRLYAVSDLSYVGLRSNTEYSVNLGDSIYVESGNYGDSYIVVAITDGNIAHYVGPAPKENVYVNGNTTEIFGSGIVAGLFEAVSETQSIKENKPAGWNYIPLGYSMHYTNGKSSTGKWISATEYLAEGTAAGSTSILGTNGTPQVLEQNKLVYRLPSINGWKMSTNRDSYYLNNNAISQVSDSYIYADAFISWSDGIIALGEVSEKLATNKVEVSL